MNKIACYKCSTSVSVEGLKPFSVIVCSQCNEKLTIPRIDGSYILEQKISQNNVYTTFKGQMQDTGKAFAFKEFSKKSFSKTNFDVLLKLLNKSSLKGSFAHSETKESFFLYREWYETSIQEYLENSRPRSEKALFLLKSIASILNELEKEKIYPAELKIGNLLMSSCGKIILSDLMIKEAVNSALKLSEKETLLSPNCISLKYFENGIADLNSSLFSFGCLAYYLCCGTYPWPYGSFALMKKARAVQPDVILKLRGDNPPGLKEMIQELINEKSNKFSSFSQVVDLIENDFKKPSTGTEKSSKQAKAQIITDSKKRKSRAAIKKQRKTTNHLPLIISVLAVFIIAVLFISLGKKNDPITAVKTKEQKKQLVDKKIIKKQKKRSALPKVVKSEIKETTVPPVNEPIAETVISPPKKDREAVKAELLPPDFNFNPLVDKLDEYIEATDKNEHELEEQRLEYVSTFKDHLLVHFYRKPYSGIFYIHKTKPFRAKISKADDDNIHLINLHNGKAMTISWKDLELNQLNEFTDYYAASFAEQFSLSESNKVMFEKIAGEYSRLAVVLDWYGLKETAIDYKKKAISFNSDLSEKLDMLIQEATTN